jgi:hypothetical protein
MEARVRIAMCHEVTYQHRTVATTTVLDSVEWLGTRRIGRAALDVSGDYGRTTQTGDRARRGGR